MISRIYNFCFLTCGTSYQLSTYNNSSSRSSNKTNKRNGNKTGHGVASCLMIRIKSSRTTWWKDRVETHVGYHLSFTNAQQIHTYAHTAQGYFNGFIQPIPYYPHPQIFPPTCTVFALLSTSRNPISTLCLCGFCLF